MANLMLGLKFCMDDDNLTVFRNCLQRAFLKPRNKHDFSMLLAQQPDFTCQEKVRGSVRIRLCEDNEALFQKNSERCNYLRYKRFALML